MELSILQAIRSFKMIAQTKGIQFKEFIGVLAICGTTYIELFKTRGIIKSSAEGEKVTINLQANVCGDILIFICSNKKSYYPGVDVMNLIDTDNELEQAKAIAVKTLRHKYKGLIALPVMLVWVIIIGFYTWFSFNNIYTLFDQRVNSSDFWEEFILFMTLIMGTFFLDKKIGFTILKPILFLIVWFVRGIRWIRNRKVE